MKLIQIHNLYDSAGRRRKLIIRFSILCIFAFVVAQVVPTLADEHAKVAEVVAEISPSPSPTVDTMTASTPSASPSVNSPTALSTPLASPTPVVAESSQGMAIQFPYQLQVDPRAQVTDLPAVAINGPANLMVCAVANNAILDIYTKGGINDQKATNLYINGDISSNLIISGPTSLVNSLLNSYGGIRVSALGTKLQSTMVHFSFIAVTGLATDNSLCGAVKVGNDRLVTFKALNIGLGMKKGKVNL